MSLPECLKCKETQEFPVTHLSTFSQYAAKCRMHSPESEIAAQFPSQWALCVPSATLFHVTILCIKDNANHWPRRE